MGKRSLTKHSYRAAERFILSREFFGMKLGLENITEFLATIHNPQQTYPTIHLSGTNGKGSCAAMLASILRAAGYKTGLYTSPHLVSLRERARVNGRLITERSVAKFIDLQRKELTRRQLSFFEVTTALAFWYFARTKVDIAVIETGLGGRLDATNVLKPILTMTPDISRDHVEILGSAIDKIAWEKAGIIKPGVPHLIGRLPRDATSTMRSVCREVGARLVPLKPSDFTIDAHRGTVRLDLSDFSTPRLRPSLPGVHQLKNAAVVLRAIPELIDAGLRITRKAVKEGLTATNWPGRFQRLSKRGWPLLVLDVAHNEMGVRAFAETFRKEFPGRRARFVLGFVKRKPHQKMVAALRPIAEDFSIVPLSTHRSTALDDLIAEVDFGDVPFQKRRSLKAALSFLLENSGRRDIIAVVGSHYLVGEFLQSFGPR